jgi:hypothetical protein
VSPRPAPPWPAATRHRLAGPVATAAAAAAATAFVGAVDPNEPGHYPTCPLLAVSGLYCPFCGGLRAVHALVRGDVATALDRNALAVIAVPAVVLAWGAWTLRAARGRQRSVGLPPALVWTLAVLVVGYAVLRNLPFGAWLAP